MYEGLEAVSSGKAEGRTLKNAPRCCWREDRLARMGDRRVD